MRNPKSLLSQIWALQANLSNRPDACRFQVQTTGGTIEYLVCSKSILLDYAPTEKLEPGKLEQVGNRALKQLDDLERVNPEVFLCDETIPLQNDDLIDKLYLPMNSKEREIGLGVFTGDSDKAIMQSVLPYQADGSFKFAGLAFYRIPEAVQQEIKEWGSLSKLNARLCKMRSSPALVLLLSCDTAMLVVTLSTFKNNYPVNSNIQLPDGIYKLDGYRDDLGVFARLVKGRQSTMRGLANPVKRVNQEAPTTVPVAETPTPPPQETPNEPQVEEVKAEQAEAIAEEVQAANPTPVEEKPKRTRTRRQPVQGGNDILKTMDDLITYLSAPVPDNMTTEAMQEEIRKLRDLNVAGARRSCNLYTAATASEKKLRDVLRGVLG